MSVTFTAIRSGRIIRTPDESAADSVSFNMSNVNAAAFLQLLTLDTHTDRRALYGSAPVAHVVRCVQGARASFGLRVPSLTRRAREGRGAGGCRFFESGTDDAYFARRLAEFAELLADWIELGADGVSWG